MTADQGQSTIPRAPEGLDARGERLWKATVERFELATEELELLTEACRCVDHCETLQDYVTRTPPLIKGSRGQFVPNPLLAALRSERLLLAKLLGQLDIPDQTEGEANAWDGLTASARARKAAMARWNPKGGRKR